MEKQPEHPVPAEAAAAEGARADDQRLELLLEEFVAPAERIPERIDGVVVGRVIAFDTEGRPLVEIAKGSAPIVARTVVPVASEDAGREAALMFERGDPSHPILMGLVQRLEPIVAPEAPRPEAPEPVESSTAEEPEERIVLSAEKDIVLQCGKASITLTRAGKIIIRGAYVVTRSTGVNRILGGTVQIN